MTKSLALLLAFCFPLFLPCVHAGSKPTIKNDQIEIRGVPFDQIEEQERSGKTQTENRENRHKEYIDAHPSLNDPNRPRVHK